MNRVVAIVALVFFVAACGGGDSGIERVTVWHQKTGPERDFFEQVVREYNAAQTDHRIETLYRETEENRNLFVIASAGGRGPELVYGPADNVSILAITGTIQPITDVLDAEYLGAFSEEGLLGSPGRTYLGHSRPGRKPPDLCVQQGADARTA